MKHRVTVKTEMRKHFLGIPYTATEKKRITVDGKTYRRMKQEARSGKNPSGPTDEEIMACAMIELEEELVDLFGEDY